MKSLFMKDARRSITKVWISIFNLKLNYFSDETITLVSAVDEQKAYMIERNTEIVTTGPYKFATSLSDQFDKLQSSFVVSKDWKLISGKTTSCWILENKWNNFIKKKPFPSAYSLEKHFCENFYSNLISMNEPLSSNFQIL